MRSGIDSSTARPLRVLLALAALTAALVIAACGSEGGIEGGTTQEEVPTASAEGEPKGTLRISNWPFYIDKRTIPEFEKETGIKVKYVEEVNDPNDFLAKVQPQFERGDSGGRDIIVAPDWMAKRMRQLGYLQDFDQEAIAPAMENLVPALRNPAFDPERKFSLPWQGGMTGLVVNKKEAPDVTSINDLFDPKYKGRVTMINDVRETAALVMKASGVDPQEATVDDWMAAIDKIREAAQSGQIRRFTGNDYTRDMANGDVVAAIGWSGDAVQLQADNPNIEFVMPDEGCILWSDNMLIPVGAPNPTAAYEFMNYVYRPENQAQIADYNYYFTPVQGTKEVLEKQGSPAAESELVFPSEEYTANCSPLDEPSDDPDELRQIEQAFQDVITGAGG